MPATTATIRRATIQAHRAVEALDARTLTQLTALYQDLAADLRRRITEAAGMDDRLTVTEMRNVLTQVEGRLATLTSARGALMDDVLREAAQLGVAPFDPISSGQLRVTTTALMRVSDDAVRFVRTFVANDGLQLSDRIWRIDRAANEAITRAIQRAVVMGQSAQEAARDLLARGEAPGPELLAKARSATAGGAAAEVEQAVTGAMYEAKRLFRTEINRAHGEAYMKAGADHPDFGGWRYMLSPAHPAPDICDLLSTQNVHGLGSGVYPSRETCPWPAHPNTLSFIEIVFKDEVTEADRAGKETPQEALARLTTAQQRGVLGVGKLDLYRQGKLGRGAIRSTLAAARRRAGVD